MHIYINGSWGKSSRTSFCPGEKQKGVICKRPPRLRSSFSKTCLSALSAATRKHEDILTALPIMHYTRQSMLLLISSRAGNIWYGFSLQFAFVRHQTNCNANLSDCSLSSLWLVSCDCYIPQKFCFSEFYLYSVFVITDCIFHLHGWLDSILFYFFFLLIGLCCCYGNRTNLIVLMSRLFYSSRTIMDKHETVLRILPIAVEVVFLFCVQYRKTWQRGITLNCIVIDQSKLSATDACLDLQSMPMYF